MNCVQGLTWLPSIKASFPTKVEDVVTLLMKSPRFPSDILGGHLSTGETKMALTLDPKRCAVMAMDFQNEILGKTPNYREKNLLGTVKRVLDAARHIGTAIVYLTVSFRDDYADAPAHSPLFQEEKSKGVMKAGSPGAAICEELTPQAGDMVINKHGVDSFNGTHLANVLRARDVDTLVLMGVWTNFVVEATARTGADSGYRIIVVTDACASNAEENHQFFIDQILPMLGTAATANDVIRALR
jgi:nicotinamidase-related amidase